MLTNKEISPKITTIPKIFVLIQMWLWFVFCLFFRVLWSCKVCWRKFPKVLSIVNTRWAVTHTCTKQFLLSIWCNLMIVLSLRLLFHQPLTPVDHLRMSLETNRSESADNIIFSSAYTQKPRSCFTCIFPKDWKWQSCVYISDMFHITVVEKHDGSHACFHSSVVLLCV